MLKISLLYKTPEENTACDILYHLSIDRTVGRICSDTRRTGYFLHVLSHPLTLPENIRYRQEILQDFIRFPALFDALKVIFSRYDKMKSDWVELRTGAHTGGSASSGNTEALLDHTYASLKVTAIFPRTILSFFSSIQETLAPYDIQSEGLTQVRAYCAEMLQNRSLEEILRISSLFQYNTPEDFGFGVLVSQGEDLRLLGCDLNAIWDRPQNKKDREREVRENEKEREHEHELEAIRQREISGERESFRAAAMDKFNKLRWGSDKDAVPAEVNVDRDAQDNMMYMLTEALYRIDSVLARITGDVYEVFQGLSSEMMFYDVALQCCAFVTDAEVPLIFPDILPAERDLLQLEGIRDFFLIGEGLKNKDIVPNDIHLDGSCDGMLICGSNNTGKTVFLRAIGTVQIFAQAGLPVCADRAVISIRHAVFSHFSAAEEDYVAGDTAGRFEGEVRDMASILDRIQPYSLVLLNETFQTTSYTEGAEGMYHILRVMPALHTKYIFVTHLLQLYDFCGGSKRVCLMRTETAKAAPGDPASRSRYKIMQLDRTNAPLVIE